MRKQAPQSLNLELSQFTMMMDLGSLAQATGNNSSGYVSDFDSNINLFGVAKSSCVAFINNIPFVRNELCYPKWRMPIRMHENSTELLWEHMYLYCPSNSMVLDTYEGTLTAAIACLNADRSCIAMEALWFCYHASFSRLCDIFDAKRAGFSWTTHYAY